MSTCDYCDKPMEHRMCDEHRDALIARGHEAGRAEATAEIAAMFRVGGRFREALGPAVAAVVACAIESGSHLSAKTDDEKEGEG
jgi:hypothetical protein